MSEANQRSVDLGLNDDEVAFYDVLAANNSAVEAMGKDELKMIAVELVTQVPKSVTIDWTLRESARAKIRVPVKRILRKHSYPPDLEGSNQTSSRPSRTPLRRLGLPSRTACAVQKSRSTSVARNAFTVGIDRNDRL
jgi:hypothetical protein